MKKETKSDAVVFRQKAEELLNFRRDKACLVPTNETDLLKLIHELEVHHIELEMQNEELVIAKEKAERAEEKYTELYDFAPSGYLSLTKDGAISELNFAAARMLGKERSHLIKKRFALFLSKETLAGFNLFVQNLFTSNTKQTCEAIIATEGNLPIYVNIDGIVSQNSELCFLTVSDITDRKKAGQALKESENLLSVIAKNYPNSYISVINKDLTVVFISGQEFYKQNLNPNDFVGLTLEQVFGEHTKIVKEHYLKTFLGEETSFELLIGNQYQLYKAVPLFDKNDEILQILAVAENITDCKKAEQALKESEEKFKALADTSPLAIYVSTGIEQKAEYINNAFIELFGYTIDMVPTVNDWWPLAYPDEKYRKSIAEEWQHKITRAIETQTEIEPMEVTVTCKDGSLKIISWGYKTIGKQNWAFGHNLTEIRKAQQIIHQQNEELQNLNADKDRFISILAHDLKSPFNTILGFIDLLTKNVHNYDIDKIEKQVNCISDSAHRLHILLENTLSWVRSQSGRLQYSPQKLNFREVFTDIFEIIRPAANEKTITINFFVGQEILLYADSNMLKTIMRNLILNAIKFTKHGGWIDISATPNMTEVLITVLDNGIGIKPNDLPRLFNFADIRSTVGTDGEKGTGLGLILCKEFVEKHNGKIWVESEVGKGSSFKFTMPLYIE